MLAGRWHARLLRNVSGYRTVQCINTSTTAGHGSEWNSVCLRTGASVPLSRSLFSFSLTLSLSSSLSLTRSHCLSFSSTHYRSNRKVLSLFSQQNCTPGCYPLPSLLISFPVNFLCLLCSIPKLLSFFPHPLFHSNNSTLPCWHGKQTYIHSDYSTLTVKGGKHKTHLTLFKFKTANTFKQGQKCLLALPMVDYSVEESLHDRAQHVQ